MEQDKKQVYIVFQNALMHSTNILIHNSKGEEIDPKEVIKLGWRIAKAVLNPEKVEKMLQEDK